MLRQTTATAAYLKAALIKTLRVVLCRLGHARALTYAMLFSSCLRWRRWICFQLKPSAQKSVPDHCYVQNGLLDYRVDLFPLPLGRR